MASPWLRNRAFVSGALVTALVVLAGFTSLVYTPHDPEAVEIQLRLKAPGGGFALGTDQFGRDVLSRLGVGASIALVVAGVATVISVAAGVPLGAAAGYLGGYVNEIVMRAMDGLLAFPALLLAIAVVAALGPGHWHAAIAIGVVGIPVFARLTRGVVLSIAAREFVSAIRAQGATSPYILLRHVMPNAMAPIIVQASLGVGRAILAEPVVLLAREAGGKKLPQRVSATLFRLLSEAKHAVLRETIDERVNVSPVKHNLDGSQQGIGLHLRPAALALGERLPPRRDRHAFAPFL